jgi:hypothetical protein
MALIPEFHVIADDFPVNASVTDLIEGMFVMLNGSGEVIKATGVSGTYAIGIAGDTKSTSLSGLPATNDALIGTTSTDTQFVNRVSDMYDETKASGKITVYHSGGKFATNEYETAPTPSWAVGLPLYVSANAKLTTASNGNAQIVAICTNVPADWPSGVPGIDVQSSITLGSYVEFKLVI